MRTIDKRILETVGTEDTEHITEILKQTNTLDGKPIFWKRKN